jgi:hypothetical protein
MALSMASASSYFWGVVQLIIQIKSIAMKKMFHSGLVIVLLTTIISGAHAQLTYKSNKSAPALSFNPLLSAPPEPNDAAGIPLKATRDFTTKYEHATDVRWSRLNNGESLVHFFSNEIETKLFYNRKGKPVSMIRYYTEDKLPADVRHLVRSAYYDFSIFLVIEVTVNKQTAHLVKIEDDTRFKTIWVMDGEMNVIEDLKKL